jgi:hypothetical protein
MSKTTTPIVLTVNDWNVSSVKYMQPKVNDRGGKSISLISTQTNRSLHLSTPLMMTWGIQDWTDEKTGESNGSYKISLNFPTEDYKKDDTTNFLNKMKDFENKILDDAVKNSEAWFGEQMSRDVAKHTFFPFLKYPKDKNTKKIDYTKAPSISPKVPIYNDKWSVEIYDSNRKLLFPNENSILTPLDFVPRKSMVACVLQCTGIWFGGKGWGVTWKLNQCAVKPQEVVSVFGQCRIPEDVVKSIETQEVNADIESVDGEQEAESEKPQVTSTIVEDSDDEVTPEPEPEVKPVVKKVVKKAPPAAEPAAVASEPEPEVKPAVKKVVKKKV